MTIKEMREAIRINTDDIKGDVLDDSMLNNLLKRSYNHIYRKIIDANVNPNVTSIELTFSANQQEVLITVAEGVPIIASNLQRAIFCKFSDGVEIPIIDMEASLKSEHRSVYVRRNFGSARLEEHYLGYHVIPSSGLTVTLYYIPKIADSFTLMEDESLIQFIPSEHHDIVINYATVLALGKDEINAKFWLGIYTESLRDMLATIGNESKKYQGVVDVEDWE